MSNTVPSDKITDLKANAESVDQFVNSNDAATTTRTGKQVRTLAGVNQQFDEMQSGVLTAQAVDAADRAETAAEQAFTAGRIYETSAAGQADTTLVDGDYFLVVSADSDEVFELWRKGASAPADTGKRTVSSLAVLSTSNTVNKVGKFSAAVTSDPIALGGGSVTSGQTAAVVNGELKLSTDVDISTRRFYVDVGRNLNRLNNLTINSSWVFQSIGGTTGPALKIFDDALMIWTTNGVIGVAGANGSSANPAYGGWSTGQPGFAIGDELEFIIEMDTDGTGKIIGNNITQDTQAVKEFHSIPDAAVDCQPWVRSISELTVSKLLVAPLIVTSDIGQIEQDLSSLDTRVTQLESETVIAEFSEPLSAVEPPEGFAWDYPFNIKRGLFSQRYYVNIVPDSLKVTTANNYYIDKDSGSDANNGSESSPFATLAAAISAGNASGAAYSVFAGSGEYSFEQTGSIPTITQDINIICNETTPAVFTLARSESSWVQNATHGNVWEKEVTGSAPLWAYDDSNKDSGGDSVPLFVRSDVAEVAANAGSVFVSGQTIYVHTFDSRQPDSSVKVIRNLQGLNAGGRAWYLENIHFYGGSASTFRCSNAVKDGCFNRVKLLYAYGNNIVTTVRNRPATTYAFKSFANYSRIRDGWNYHNSGDDPAHNVLEVDCAGNFNGLQEQSNNNGSTMHDGGYVIRVNGNYSYNMDRNVHDVNAGTEVWMLGGTVGDALNTQTSDFNNANFLFGGSGGLGPVKAWLESCDSLGGAVTDYGCYGLGSELKLRNCNITQFTTLNGDGDISGY